MVGAAAIESLALVAELMAAASAASKRIAQLEAACTSVVAPVAAPIDAPVAPAAPAVHSATAVVPDAPPRLASGRRH